MDREHRHAHANDVLDAPGNGIVDIEQLHVEENARALAGQPLGRAATVEEIADVVTFLCSPRAGWATGIVVDLDGGQTYR